MIIKNNFLTIWQEFGIGNARQLQLLRYLVGWSTPANFKFKNYDKQPSTTPLNS